jgi:hypothetical protein
MYRELAGRTIGSPEESARYECYGLLVDHDGTKFEVTVWALDEKHALNRLACVAGARWFYRVIDVYPDARRDEYMIARAEDEHFGELCRWETQETR